MRIYGSKMTINLDMFNQNLYVYSNKATKSCSFASFGSNIDHAMLDDYLNAYMLDQPPPVTGEDGIEALKVALKAYESNSKNAIVHW